MASGETMQNIRTGICILAGILGLMCLFFAYSLRAEGVALRELVAEIEALPAPNKAQRGERVAAEGRIAPDTRPLTDDFVAFQRTEYKCATPGELRCGSEDVEVEAQKQPLTLTTDDGPLRIGNDDYRFDDRVIEWADIKRLEQEPTLTTFARTVRGFVTGSPIVALGRVESVEPELVVRAETIMAGTRAKVVAGLIQSGERVTSAVLYMLLAGGVLLLYAGWEGRRVFRT